MGKLYCKICNKTLGETSGIDIEAYCEEHAKVIDIQKKEIADKTKQVEELQKQLFTLTLEDIIILKQIIAEHKAPK